MSIRSILVCCVALAAAWVVSVGQAQPLVKDDPAAKPKTYTAFPELKVPLQEHLVRGRPDYDNLIARLEAGRTSIARRMPEDAAPLRKVRLAQLTDGIAYIKMVFEIISTGRFNDPDFKGLVEMSANVCRIGVELNDEPVEKKKWLENSVVMSKFYELYVEARTEAGTIGTQQIYYARFHRLQAEADLLLLKAEIEKGRKP
jgi:hypothetical protein